MKQMIHCLLLLSTLSSLSLIAAQPFDYPTANISTQWTNSPSLEHTVSYPSGATVRAILLRGSFAPSFACGFFCTGACDAFLFSIFIVYTNSGSRMTAPMISSPQVVWVANRGRPVKENATLEFSKDGNLILRDVDGSTVWSTNTSGRSVAGMNVTDIGTLELFDNSNSSVWSSINHPTDSWVLGQTLRQGQRLTANVSATNSTQGQLYLSIVNGGFKTYVGSNPPQLYYSNVVVDAAKIARNRSTYITFANGSLAIFTKSTDPRSPDATVPLPPASSLQYMRLDYGGHLRLYQWNMSGWQPLGDVFELYPDDCAYPTVCGEYGICSDGQCSCPTGTGSGPAYFRPIDARQPNLGCTPITTLSCSSNASRQLLALESVSYFDYLDDSAAAMRGTNEESCKQGCMMNCSCKAAVFVYTSNASNGDCFLPSQLFSMANNNPAVSHVNSSVFIKVQNPQAAAAPSPPEFSSSTEKKQVSVSAIVGSTVGAVFAAFVIVRLVIAFVKRRKHREFDEDDQFDMVPGIPARFSFEELRIATENFCRKLGEGGFGSVFEGTLRDGTKVAVKRLDGVGQGKKEFLAEVETIGSIHHINLVRLIGFCADKSHRLLVYEYMSNGSLDKWIFYKGQDVAFDWETRRRIITDIAKGLAYLHEECRQKIVHLDIKPQNILLDEEFNAKVSDFGLSKLIDRDQSQVVTRMRGTPGYLAPEWLTSVITEKADVYSFGVVVMEVVCGRKNLDYSQPEECIHLVSLLEEKAEGDRLSDLIDRHSADMQQHVDGAVEMMKLAMWCLQSDNSRRPSMSVVLKVLEGSMTADSNIDYKFSSPAPYVSHNADNGLSAPPSISLLSGPR